MSHEKDLNAIQPETEKVTYAGMIGLIVLVVGLGGIVIVATFLGLKGSISYSKASRVAEGSPAINQIRQTEEQILGEYKALENGKYRIPIQTAIDLIVAENTKKGTSPALIEDINQIPADPAKDVSNTAASDTSKHPKPADTSARGVGGHH